MAMADADESDNFSLYSRNVESSHHCQPVLKNVDCKDVRANNNEAFESLQNHVSAHECPLQATAFVQAITRVRRKIDGASDPIRKSCKSSPCRHDENREQLCSFTYLSSMLQGSS
jgi:hypothetical protein